MLEKKEIIESQKVIQKVVHKLKEIDESLLCEFLGLLDDLTTDIATRKSLSSFIGKLYDKYVKVASLAEE